MVRCDAKTCPLPVALDTLVLQAANGYNQHAIFGALVGVVAHTCEHHEEGCFFIFVSAFLLGRKENAFLLEIRYIVGVNVTLGRFLM